MMNDRDISEQLRESILAASMSRYSLAKKADVSEAVLSRFVNRKRTITVETAAKIARVLGLELRSKKRAVKDR